MIVLPAIDVLGGKVVRLTRGNYQQSKVYLNDPGEAAVRWKGAGAKMVHMVDLDGARDGMVVNWDSLGRIMVHNVAIQFGGGVRSTGDLKTLLEMGVRHVMIGTRAVESSHVIGEWIGRYGPEKIGVSLDSHGDNAAVAGWTVHTDRPVEELLKQMLQAGARRFVYTDIQYDGTLESGLSEGGEDARLSRIRRILDAAQPSAAKIIVSGGISHAQDVTQLAALKHPALEGVIVGRALYEGTAELSDMIRAAESDCAG